MSEQLPSHLLVDLIKKNLSLQAISFYITQSGDLNSGTFLVKIFRSREECRLRGQERDFLSGELKWIDVLDQESVAENEADAYIARIKARDPDVWIIEIEDDSLENPFEV